MNQPKQSQLSMLSVDDDGELRELLHELICQMGHASVTAADGIDALEKMEEKQFRHCDYRHQYATLERSRVNQADYL